nr:Dipeptide-binding protein [Moritella viscosa]
MKTLKTKLAIALMAAGLSVSAAAAQQQRSSSRYYSCL